MNRTIGSLTVLLFAASLVFALVGTKQTAHAWEDYSSTSDPYSYSSPRHSDPYNDGSLSHSPSHDLYGRETWDAPPAQQRQQEDHSYQPSSNYNAAPSFGGSRSDTLLSTPGQPDKLCTHGYNLTYCY